MKKMTMVLVLAGIFLGGTAQAESTCETVRKADDSGKRIHYISFSKLTEAKVAELETITKQQIIIGMNAILGKKFRSTYEAVSSQDLQDGFLEISFLKGKRYVSVGHFPGDNEVSVMFEYGGLSIIGQNNDGSVDCF